MSNNNIKEINYPMQILTHFNETIKTLNTSLYILQTNIDPMLVINDKPDNIESLISAPEIRDLIDKASNAISDLTTALKPISKVLKKHKYSKQIKPMQEYANFTIDKPPLVKTDHYKVQSFQEIMNTNPVKPINRRIEIDYAESCPKCGAPNNYVYKHTNTQFRCKACLSTFTLKVTKHEELTHHCPYCKYKLSLHKERKNYDVLVCYNKNCSFYISNKKLLESGQGDHLRTSSDSYKLRYHFRLFDFSMASIRDLPGLTINTKVDLAKIQNSYMTLGLVLTYYVNYGLSSRKTAQILRDVHGIRLSHQTVINYSEAAASILEYLNNNYEYNLNNTITFDETYIKVSGKNHYVFFGSDTESKIITSYRIFSNRTTKEAVITLNETFKKFKEPPNDLTIITDGNPIYNAAQVFYSLNYLNFDLHQVIGVKNNDEVSRKYRHYKQAEERLNRTYKQNYYGTNGYGNLRNANVYMSLYVTFFNFLRTHSSLGYKTPIKIEGIGDHSLMYNKWLFLIDYTINLVS